MNDAALVHAARELINANASADVVAELLHELDVHVRLDQRHGNLLQKRIDNLDTILISKENI